MPNQPIPPGPVAVLALDSAVPEVEETAIVLPGAAVVGAVTLHAGASVWYAAVIRADNAPIRIGARSNVQDGAVLHADPGFSTTVGARVTIGHGAIVHGATVGADCLIGMRSTVMNGARIGAGSLIAAGSVVREGTVVPPGSMVAGVPATVRRAVREAEAASIDQAWRDYVALAARHARAHGMSA